MSHGASWPDFVCEFGEGDSSILVLVHFLYQFIDFFLGHIEASALDHPLELLSADLSGTVEIEGIEGVVHVEAGHTAEPLAHGLGLVFGSQMGPPDASEFFSGQVSEAVVTSV